MKVTMTKGDVTVEIEMDIAELQTVLNALNEDSETVDDSKQANFTGDQEDLSFLSNWTQVEIYRGIVMYADEMYRIMFTDKGFDERRKFEDIEQAKKYVDYLIDVKK